MRQMRTFHVFEFTLLVEQLDDPATSAAPSAEATDTDEVAAAMAAASVAIDEGRARTIASTAVRHAAALATELTGRQMSVGAISMSPLKVIELESS